MKKAEEIQIIQDIKQIQQIQLDAIKEGMRRAAEIGEKQECENKQLAVAYTSVKEAILSAAEQLTTKDL